MERKGNFTQIRPISVIHCKRAHCRVLHMCMHYISTIHITQTCFIRIQGFPPELLCFNLCTISLVCTNIHSIVGLLNDGFNCLLMVHLQLSVFSPVGPYYNHRVSVGLYVGPYYNHGVGSLWTSVWFPVGPWYNYGFSVPQIGFGSCCSMTA